MDLKKTFDIAKLSPAELTDLLIENQMANLDVTLERMDRLMDDILASPLDETAKKHHLKKIVNILEEMNNAFLNATPPGEGHGERSS